MLLDLRIGCVQTAVKKNQHQAHGAYPEPHLEADQIEIEPRADHQANEHEHQHHRNADAFGRAAEKDARSEEHTSELQSRGHLVCRLLLEKKKKNTTTISRQHLI